MKKTVLVFVLILLNLNSLRSALIEEGIDSKTIALGNSFFSLIDNSNAVFLNPAGLSFLTKSQVSLGYSNLYGLTELSLGSLSWSYPLKSWSFGVGLSIFGKSDFYQEKLGVISAAYNFKNKIGVGISLKYLILSTSSDYPELKAFSLDLGFRGKFLEKIAIGGVVKNLNEPKFKKNAEKIPLNYNLALAYNPFKEIGLMVAYFDDSDFKSQFRFGQETKIGKNLALRFGFQTQPSRYSFGAGFIWEKFKIDYAYFNHPDLEASHSVNLTLELNQW